MDIKIEEKKSLSLIKRQVEGLELRPISRITSQKEAESIVLFRKSLKEIEKNVKEEKEKITKPLNEALKSVRDLFRPYEEKLELINKAIGSELLIWDKKKADELAIKNKEVEDKIAKGSITFEKASKIVEKVEAKIETIPTREITKARVTDIKKLDYKYLIPDMVAIKRDLMAGTKVEGAELYKEKIIAG